MNLAHSNSPKELDTTEYSSIKPFSINAPQKHLSFMQTLFLAQNPSPHGQFPSTHSSTFGSSLLTTSSAGA